MSTMYAKLSTRRLATSPGLILKAVWPWTFARHCFRGWSGRFDMMEESGVKHNRAFRCLRVESNLSPGAQVSGREEACCCFHLKACNVDGLICD